MVENTFGGILHMLNTDNLLNVNFDVKRLSLEELNEARAIIRQKLSLMETIRFVATRRGKDTSRVEQNIKELTRLLNEVKVETLKKEVFC